MYANLTSFPLLELKKPNLMSIKIRYFAQFFKDGLEFFLLWADWVLSGLIRLSVPMWHRVSQRLFLLMLLNNLSKRCTRKPIAQRIQPRSASAIQIFFKEPQPRLTRLLFPPTLNFLNTTFLQNGKKRVTKSDILDD